VMLKIVRAMPCFLRGISQSVIKFSSGLIFILVPEKQETFCGSVMVAVKS
jgi:hypothetical protein